MKVIMEASIRVFFFCIKSYFNDVNNCIKRGRFIDELMEKVISRLISKPGGYGVYIHWPYCSRICSYCNFNKYRQPSNALAQEHQLKRSFTSQLRYLLHEARFPNVTSVYFGGGTPSLAHPFTISSILNTIETEVGLADGAEITLEVNPSLDVLSKLEGV